MDKQKVAKDIIELIELFGYIDSEYIKKYLVSLDLKDKGVTQEASEYDNGYAMAFGTAKSYLLEKFQYLLPDDYKKI